MVEQLERIETATDSRPTINPDVKPPWWFKWPTLIVNTKLHVIDQGRKTTHTEAAQVFEAARPMLQTITREFERAGCSTITVSNNGESPVTTNGSQENPNFSITVNPVYLGALPKQVERALTDYTLRPNDENLLASLKKHLPEEKTPLLSGIGNRLLRLLHIRKNVGRNKDEKLDDLKKRMENGFVNMIFVRDDNGAIAAAPDRAKQLFNWALMAKVGAFKESINAFTINNEGQVEFSDPILATLEGGHPFLDTIGLAQHLMVIGSTKAVGGADEIKDVEPIPQQLWRNSLVVDGLRNLGRFLGSKDLMAPPLAFHQFVKSRKLKHKLIELAQYSRQAEGAFWAWAASKKMVESISHMIQSPLTGVAIVTSSGRFGAIKTNLGFKDLVASVPARVVGFIESAKVLYLRVKGHKVRKPSVEAEEITNPAFQLAEDDPINYVITLQEVEGGFKVTSEGDLKAPLVKGEVHLHDEMAIKDGVPIKYEELGGDEIIVNEKAGIFQVPTDEFPAFGCGVDQMQEMSMCVMKKAFDIWIKRGKKDKLAIFYVPNHGYNVITFWAKNEKDIIPADPFAHLKEAIINGDLVVTKGVHQRHYYRPLDAYYARQTKKAA